MGFDPQNAGEPIVNVQKRTTKVNFSIVAAVAVFIAIGVCALIWVAGRSDRGQRLVDETATPKMR